MGKIRRKFNIHNLRRARVRQDWNKYNLYNLSRLKFVNIGMTFFQQKWKAKAATRAYHGETMREKQWERAFSRSVPAVVPMRPDYLAKTDGSEFAAGRGSGLEQPPGVKQRRAMPMPYHQMVYHPTERRLDTAIFRALFSSSIRGARQHVTHGHVKVNGKPMRHPGYLLNPGDMFQVNPDMVMVATGQGKVSRQTRALQLRGIDPLAAAGRAAATSTASALPRVPDGSPKADDAADLVATEAKAEPIPDGGPVKATKHFLKSLRLRTEELLTAPLTATKKDAVKQKQEVRAFAKALERAELQAASHAAKKSPAAVDDLEAAFAALSAHFEAPSASAPPPASSAAPASAPAPASGPSVGSGIDALQAAFGIGPDALADPDNPIDLDRPYVTPWRPRHYMAAFAFIPRFLEVNQNVCAAVYLRHPVVRPGFAEVPTPFTPEMNQLTFNWYLRRR